MHADIDERGEPLAALTASDGGIYEHFGYGIASQVRVISIDTRDARFRPEYRVAPGSVRYLEGDEIAPALNDVWERFRRCRAGEVAVDLADHRFNVERLSKPEDSASAALYLGHADGFAVYRITMRWNDGHPAHDLELLKLAAVTPEAHAALWQTLLSIDLVRTITTRWAPVDDALPFLLENQRAVRTTNLNDGIWLNVRDVSVCFGARTYRSTDRLVVEAEGQRWAIEGGPDGASCRTVRSKPDLVTTHAWLSALLYGGVQPSTLVSGRRMTARNDDVLRRADLFFPTSLAPNCQTHF